LRTAAQVTNLVQAAHCTQTRTISTQLPDGQDSRRLISFANMTRIKRNLHSESLFAECGFQDI
jgi:hypothetical protein